MSKKSFYSQLAESKYLFYFVLFLNVVLLCFTRFYPSMDGPAHLYNTNILNHLIKGNTAISAFFSINHVTIPNWTSQFILSFFHFFMPAWLAEKTLLIIYVSGMALSFRFLIKELRPVNISLSILVFPFIYSFLFHLGFYNFSISFILFFTTLAFWLRSQSDKKLYNHLLLFLLITTAYFSNVLIFLFLGLTIGLFILYYAYNEYIHTKYFSLTLRHAGKKLLSLFLVSVPGLVFLFLFYTSVTFYPNNQSYPVKELIRWILIGRSFIVYSIAREEIITGLFFYVLLGLLALSIFHKGKIREEGQFTSIRKVDIFIIPLVISLVLLFVIPNGSSAGMMSDRYCLMFFMLLLTWTVSRALPAKFNSLFIYFVLVLHFGLLFKHINGSIRKLNSDAVTICKAENYVNQNSIVLPINLSDNWLEIHFSNYLGIDKPMIILENYEAAVGWFPVKWNTEKMPKILLGDRNSISGFQWVSNSNSRDVRQIDDILLYGNMSKINDPNWSELKATLASDFKLKYRPADNYLMLFERCH